MNWQHRLKLIIERTLSVLFRRLVTPLRRLLPARHQARLITLAHYIKLTLFQGHTEPFAHNLVPRREAERLASSGWGDEVRKEEILPAIQADAEANKEIADKVTRKEEIVPAWVIDELKELAEIEPNIYPTREFIERFHIWVPPADPMPGKLFAECYDAVVASRPDVVFLVPWIKRGGADLGTLHYVNQCVAAGRRVTVITTRDGNSPWLARLPWHARAIEFGRLAVGIQVADQQLVLTRLLLQSGGSVIHVVQSQLGWEVFSTYGRALKASGKHLYASLFCDELNEYGVRQGYGTAYFAETYRFLDAVISDNSAFLKSLRQHYGAPSSLLHTAYFPMRGTIVSCCRGADVGRRLLWASRLTKQKRPEVLLEIAKRLPLINIDVFGESDETLDPLLFDSLSQQPNIRLCGAYDAFEQIVGSGDYALFVYTSAYDGLPNVLLEAIASGLPAVAPDVGGISELIDDTTGYLVRDGGNALEYVARIEEALADRAERRHRWEKARVRLEERHSLAAFHKAMTAIPGYTDILPATDGSVVACCVRVPCDVTSS